MRRGRGRFAVFLVAVILLASVPGWGPATATAQTPGRGEKVIVDNGDVGAAQLLVASGATRIEDYGAFSLWRVPAAIARTVRATSASITPATEFDTIQFRNEAIDTTGPVPLPARTNARQVKGAGEQLWVVQFVGPIKPDWLDGLRKEGLEVVQYVPNNAYVVWGGGGAVDTLERSVAAGGVRQFSGAYHPAYRLAPDLLEPKQPLKERVDVTVQFYKHTGVDASIAAVTALGGGKLIRERQELGNLVDITLSLSSADLLAVASRADVFNVEPFATPKKNDEAQGQILAANLTTSGGNMVPTGPGYLAWLQAKGFPTDPAQYPVVAVVDDGVGAGTTTSFHPDFHQLGDPAAPSRIAAVTNCTSDMYADGQDGHGNLNASIVVGYNDRTGAAYEDANGYNYGLGISPYGRVANEKIFANSGTYDISACGNSDAGVVQAAVNAGAQIGSNSWGSNSAGAYDADARAYDILTRDANGTAAGNQGMLQVFAAGNAGPNATTVGSPGTAKNVLTVGATENVRDDGVLDGCSYSGANNADDAATFSSRGPAADGRSKPDITAPGTHITGAASQVQGYNGSGVCGASGADNRYYPAGQTLYTWSSGTSHSTPAVSGAASLLYNYYGRVLAPGQTPSPAMLKALLLNTPRYLNGSGTGGTLPQTAQGWGDVNLATLFDSSTSRIIKDQTNVLTATGQSVAFTGTVTDTSKPLRVTLVYTDAPGATTGAAYVNNLDLTVTIGNNSYRGNVFNGANSVTGGTADAKNNVESVFLPAGTGGNFAVRIVAANLAGVGVPGAAGTVNQDFALVISNATEGSPLAALSAGSATVNDYITGNGNGVIDAGERITVTIPVSDEGTLAAQNVVVSLTTSTPLVTINGTPKTIGTLAAGTGTTASFTVDIGPTFVCGNSLTLNAQVTSGNAASVTQSYTFTTGKLGSGTGTTYTSTDVPKAIPDNNPAGINSTLAVASGATSIGKVTVRLTINHTWDGDVIAKLIAPNMTTITLVARRGSSGDNFTSTVFDDDAATSIVAGAPPFMNTYRPEQPLSAANLSNANGTWTLNVSDNAATDTGTLVSWSITVAPAVYVCASPTPPVPTLTSVSPKQSELAGGKLATLTGTGFQPGMTVKFGTTTALVQSVASNGTTAVVTVPPATAPGKVDVSVQLGTGTPAVLTQAFEYGIIAPAPSATHGVATTSMSMPAPAPVATHIVPTPGVPSPGDPTPRPMPIPR